MTFASETVRILYHQLPTDTQVMYADWETRLAQRRCQLHIEAVMRHERISEVIVRITEQFNFSAPIRRASS